MKLIITPDAHQWFKDELKVETGDAIRFLGKVYGATEIHEGFSVGLRLEDPINPLVKSINEGITYFIEKQDEWFLSGHDLTVNYNKEQEIPAYHFHKK